MSEASQILPENSGPVLVLGAGKMGGALIAGWLAHGMPPGRLILQDPALAPEMQALANDRGLRVEATVEALPEAPAVILAAVKPQVMDDIFPAAARLAGPETVTVSIAAGRTLASFEKHLAPGAPVVRAMPNTPAAIGHGMTVCCANTAVSSPQRELATRLLSAVGKVAWIDDEALMNAVTAVSGSGPAYVFHLAECMTAAGVAAGLSAELAAQLSRETIAGAGALLSQSDLDAAKLRQNVTSPGGTTAAALEVFMKEDALASLVEAAILAARERGEELG